MPKIPSTASQRRSSRRISASKSGGDDTSKAHSSNAQPSTRRSSLPASSSAKRKAARDLSDGPKPVIDDILPSSSTPRRSGRQRTQADVNKNYRSAPHNKRQSNYYNHYYKRPSTPPPPRRSARHSEPQPKRRASSRTPRRRSARHAPAREPSESGDEDEVYEVEAILARSLFASGSAASRKEFHYLVRWRGWSPEYDTWEPRSGLEDASECLEQYENHPSQFTILEMDDDYDPVRVLARHCIAGEDSPMCDEEWTTEEELRETYPANMVKVAMRAAKRNHKLAMQRKRDLEGNVTVKGHKVKTKGYGKYKNRTIWYRVQWQEDGHEVEEWLTTDTLRKHFPQSGPPAVAEYRAGVDVVKTEPIEPENDYDRERLRNIEMNRSLMLQLGLGLA